MGHVAQIYYRIICRFLVALRRRRGGMCEYIFKVVNRAVGYECVDRIELAECGIVRRAFVNTLMNFWIP